MKRLFSFFVTCIFVNTLLAQIPLPQADLLNVRFKQTGTAEDESVTNFSILNGSVSTPIVYDSSVKRYVSQYRNTSGNQFFRFYYGDNQSFKDQLSKSFTIELYTKIKTASKAVPFATTQGGGLGIAQNDQFGSKLWFYQNNNNYAFLGSGSLYSAANNKYDHIVYTYNKSTNTINSYLNGKLEKSLNNVKDLKFADKRYQWFFIGGDVSSVDNKAELVYYGDIATVKMYSKDLSGSEINSLYTDIQNRNNFKEIDDLNNIISSLLPQYINNQTDTSKKEEANNYLTEGWNLMYAESVSKTEITEYINKVQTLLRDYIVTADLLDVKFMDNHNATDISLKKFNLEQGSVLPYNEYDPNIKQYVSKFSNYNTSKTNRFYKINYKDNADFKNKIQKSFTFELYIKANSSGLIAPAASTQNTGFGVSQIKGGGDLQFLFADGTAGYNKIAGQSIYSATEPKYNHVVFTYDEATKTLTSYYNGNLVATKKTLKNLNLPQYNDQYLFIGGDVASDKTIAEFPYDGDIATVRIYSQALNGLEVNNLYQQLINRKSLANADNLNEIIANKLPSYIEDKSNATKKKLAEKYLTEGWDLMNSFSSTAEQISAYLNRVASDLGLDSTPQADYNYPRFAVISDLHIGAGDNNIAKVKQTFEILSQQTKPLDAIFIVGDLTEGGTAAQNETAAGLMSAISPAIPAYTLLGNHDWFNTYGGSYFGGYFGNLNKTLTIKGYPFILLSDDPVNTNKEDFNYYNETTLNFLKNALAEATTKYPDKPIFVHAHVPAQNTSYGSWGEVGQYFYSQRLREILKGYEQVIVFSGHLHTPIGDERSIFQEDFTSVNDGTIAFTTRIPLLANGQKFDDLVGTNRPPQNNEVAEGFIVQIEPNDDVTIQRWDFFRNNEIKTPWVVKAPHKKENFVYTIGRTGGEAPYFDSFDKITFSKVAGTSSTITFPQANDDDLVDYYKIKILDQKGNLLNKKEYIISSRFYLNTDIPTHLSWNITTPLNNKYLVQITAFDSFGNESQPLSQWFQTGVGVIQAETRSLDIAAGDAPSIVSNDKQIKVITNGLEIDKAVLYNLKGSIIETKSNQISDFELGENCTPGVYIINVQYNGKTLNQKVSIK